MNFVTSVNLPMDARLIERSAAERMFTRQCRTAQMLLADSNTSIRIIERHLAELTTRWTVLQEKHDLYVAEFIHDTTESAANDALINSYLSEFLRLEAACDSFMPPTSNTASNIPAATSNSIKLERVKFRIFDGDLRKYPKFKSEFETFVKPLCQQAQLPFVLKSYLCDSVRREVEHIDHDVAAMWSRLDEKYGSLQKQIDHIMKDFKALPVCNDLSSTLSMISLVEHAYADLECMNAANELNNSLIISEIENSMSSVMMNAWAEKIANDSRRNSSETKLPMLLDFLKHWRWLVEYCEADLRTPTSFDSCSESSSSDSGRHQCLVHRDAHHPIWRCRSFRAMSVTERGKIVSSNNACTLCLETGHSVTNCSKSFRCTSPGCRSSQHNVLLHDLHT